MSQFSQFGRRITFDVCSTVSEVRGRKLSAWVFVLI